MQKFFILGPILLLTSCGLIKWPGETYSEKARVVASLSVQQLLEESNEDFTQDINSRLLGLHIYHTLAQKNLLQFDEDITSTDIKAIYQTDSYLKLMAIRTQIEEIENDIIEAAEDLHSGPKKSKSKIKLLHSRVLAYAEISQLARAAMENLAAKLETVEEIVLGDDKISASVIEDEIMKLKKNNEFIVYRQNIEHLAHMLKIDAEESNSKANITGNEFPAKVWALTFDDGPHRKITPEILENLNQKKLGATFFQLTETAKANRKMIKKIKANAKMEIASHSYTHLELTKVGTSTLEYEILTAKQDLEKIDTNLDIRFFRLPYGAGMNSGPIREMIANAGVIHVFWNIDSLDWIPQRPSQIVTRTLSLMKKTQKDSGVILFHDVYKRTLKALPEVLDYLNSDGRRVCTIGKIVDYMNANAEIVCPKE